MGDVGRCHLTNAILMRTIPWRAYMWQERAYSASISRMSCQPSVISLFSTDSVPDFHLYISLTSLCLDGAHGCEKCISAVTPLPLPV